MYKREEQSAAVAHCPASGFPSRIYSLSIKARNGMLESGLMRADGELDGLVAGREGKRRNMGKASAIVKHVLSWRAGTAGRHRCRRHYAGRGPR